MNLAPLTRRTPYSVMDAPPRNIDAAPLEVLERWIAERSLGEDEVVRALRRRDLTRAQIESILEHPPWAGLHKVQAGVTRHPQTPRQTAQHYIYYLYWKELVDILRDLAVPPPVRQMAENLLEDKIGEMTLGERIALARLPNRGVVKAVRRMEQPEVLRVLVGNSMLVEEDVLFIINRPHAAPEVLEAVANTARWRSRPAVRFDLVRHPRTPRHVVHQLLVAIPTKDLKAFASSPMYSSHLRQSARRVLKDRGALGTVVKALLLTALLLPASACGYTLAGRSSTLPAHIQKVHIPYFENQTPRIEIEQRLTEQVQREFSIRARIKLVNSWNEADAVLQGVITKFEVRPIGFNQQTQANRYQVIIEVKAHLLDQSTSSNVWESQNFVFRSEYESPETIEDYFNQEITAIDDIAASFAQTLVSTITQGF